MTDHHIDPLVDPERARLVSRARLHKYDATLEAAADLFESGNIAAWQQLHPRVQDLSGMYIDSRRDYREAVKAGAIPADDRGPGTA